MKEYHKIDGLYIREEATKRLMPGEYRNPMVDYLQNNIWMFTEKIDGTNIRVVWDGHRVSFYGRTDKAVIPKHLMERLEYLFAGEANEQVFEQHFGGKSVILYGEGYGAKIQNGGDYRSDVDFILFDVEVNGMMLSRASVEGLAKAFGIDAVPVVLVGTIHDAEEFVKQHPDSTIGNAKMEGVVGRPLVELFDRHGNRVIVKIKVRDFDEIERYSAENSLHREEGDV